MNAKQTIETAVKGQGCLGKAADDEPVFVLRAQDKWAPLVVRIWATLANAHAGMDSGGAKILGALEICEQMKAWQGRHHTKQPD